MAQGLTQVHEELWWSEDERHTVHVVGSQKARLQFTWWALRELPALYLSEVLKTYQLSQSQQMHTVAKETTCFFVFSESSGLTFSAQVSMFKPSVNVCQRRIHSSAITGFFARGTVRVARNSPAVSPGSWLGCPGQALTP